jgi:4-hydroxy-tetrahydrodipicolinate reductase
MIAAGAGSVGYTRLRAKGRGGKSVLRVTQMGLGPIGRAVAQRVARHPAFELVSAADPAHAGARLDALLGVSNLAGEVASTVAEALARGRPDLVLHTTGSYLEAVAPELRPILEAGVGIVSTCEELSFPFYRHPGLARELDALARQRGVVLVGTGVNPGFVMDKLVATLMAACDVVSAVRVQRIVDAATRRESFQRKIGAGLSPSAFEAARAQGRLGHVGLAETAHMLAEAIGVGTRRELEEELSPVLAERRLATEFLTVEVGQVAGIRQSLRLSAEGRERVALDIEMAVGAAHPRDAVQVEGSPPLELEIPSGVPGDEGTAAVVVGTARAVPALAPGLRTMLDVPLRPAASRM